MSFILPPRLKVHVGSFTRDTTLASGNQAVTGVGFRPKAVLFLYGQDATTGEAGFGVDDLTTAATMYDRHNNVADTWGVSTARSIHNEHAGGAVNYQGLITTLDADGFTMAWTKNGLPTGTIRMNYLALG